jgi:hypothetical protein
MFLIFSFTPFEGAYNLETEPVPIRFFNHAIVWQIQSVHLRCERYLHVTYMNLHLLTGSSNILN